MPAGSQVFIRVSGSIERIPAIMRSCISFITASCIGCRSGNPKNVRASSGVQSMSIWTFMGGLQMLARLHTVSIQYMRGQIMYGVIVLPPDAARGLDGR